MWSLIVSKVLGVFGEKVVDTYSKKVELKAQIKLEELKGKVAYQVAKTKRAEQSEGRDETWELESLRNSGYKDEWVLALISVPMIMSFIPSAQDYVRTGFDVLEATPQWYRFIIMSVFLAVYGIRWWRRKV